MHIHYIIMKSILMHRLYILFKCYLFKRYANCFIYNLLFITYIIVNHINNDIFYYFIIHFYLVKRELTYII